MAGYTRRHLVLCVVGRCGVSCVVGGWYAVWIVSGSMCSRATRKASRRCECRYSVKRNRDIS